jgi:hypothetical protein
MLPWWNRICIKSVSFWSTNWQHAARVGKNLELQRCSDDAALREMVVVHKNNQLN